jgi:Uma2 family endonuclease
MARQTVKYYDEVAYLSFERSSFIRYEYCNGEIIPQKGETFNHNLIENNVRGNIGLFLKGKNCRSFGTNMRVKSISLYAYPDILIFCGEPLFEDNFFDTLLNPSVIIEILSESTANYDKGLKFELYREIPSLEEYILIDSRKIHLEHYLRNSDKSWTLQEYKIASASFTIVAIDMPVTLNDWYEGVAFK